MTSGSTGLPHRRKLQISFVAISIFYLVWYIILKQVFRVDLGDALWRATVLASSLALAASLSLPKFRPPFRLHQVALVATIFTLMFYQAWVANQNQWSSVWLLQYLFLCCGVSLAFENIWVHVVFSVLSIVIEAVLVSRHGQVSPEALQFLSVQASLLVAGGIQLHSHEAKQRELITSERWYRMLFERAEEGIFTLDSDFRIDHLNSQLLEMLGYPRHECEGFLFASFVHPHDLEVLQSQQARRERGEKGRFSIRLLKKSGEVAEVLVSESPVFEVGQLTSVVGFISEISEIKEMHRKLEESEASVRTILDSIPGYVSWVSRDLVYQGVNRTLADSYGVAKEQFIGQPMGFLEGEGPAKLKTLIREFFDSPFAQRICEFDPPVAGQQTHTLLSIAKIHDGGQAILIGIDISEKKRIERELEEQRVRSFNASRMASLGEMAAGIAHEINNPLAVIVGTVDRLDRLAEADLIDRQTAREPLDKILEMVERMARIIRGLRAFARDGQQDPFEQKGVREIVGETLEFCFTKFRNSGVNLRVPEVPSDLILQCRSTQISQVLLNLLNNAYDAVVDTPDAWVELRVAVVHGMLEISVTDSGAGISPEIVEKIMQPFFTTKEVGKGTGLGLSISLGIVKSHSGVLSYDSASPNTRFVISLPLFSNHEDIAA